MTANDRPAAARIAPMPPADQPGWSGRTGRAMLILDEDGRATGPPAELTWFLGDAGDLEVFVYGHRCADGAVVAARCSPAPASAAWAGLVAAILND